MSVEFLNLARNGESSMRANYFLWTQDAAVAREKEIAAIGSIQKAWRGYNARKYLGFLNAQSTLIQKAWRGYLGRSRFSHIKYEKVLSIERAFYDLCATRVQCVWRGFISRKLKQDYYNRKKYIEYVSNQAADLRSNVENDIGTYRAYLAQKKEDEDAKQFASITSNIHHLMGTYTQPGIYNSVYGEQYATTAYGIPLESHIHENAMNELERRKMEKTMRKEARRQRKVKSQEQEAKEEYELGTEQTVKQSDKTKKMSQPPVSAV